MITKILIVLVAVVLLIIIIVGLSLHFLRADDSDTFEDEMPAEPRGTRRSPAKPPHRPAPDPASGRRTRPPEPARAQATRDPWPGDRPVRPEDNGYRDRDTGPRPAAPARRNGQSSGPRPTAASVRAANAAKAPGPDAPAGDWDSLSDVDYWAQLGADKPQVTPAASAPPPARPNGSSRRGPDAKPVGRTAPQGRAGQRDSGPMPGGPAPAGSLPVRPRPQAARAGYGEPATESLAALARLSSPPATPPRPDGGSRPGSQRPGSGARSADGQRPGPSRRQSQPPLVGGPAAQLPQPTGYARTPAPLDDDPLTSPSFPAINTSDSRSYRGRRSRGSHSGPQTGPQPAADFTRPTTQHPVSPPVGPPQISAPQPVANPYGSYVSASRPAYQDMAVSRGDLPAYGGYGNGQQPDAAWYGDAATGYLPGDGYAGNGNGHNGNGHNGSGYAVPDQHDGQGGYGAADYQDFPYQRADYPPAPSVNNGYANQHQQAGQFDDRGYGAPDPAYGPEGYEGYRGYGPGSR